MTTFMREHGNYPFSHLLHLLAYAKKSGSDGGDAVVRPDASDPTGQRFYVNEHRMNRADAQRLGQAALSNAQAAMIKVFGVRHVSMLPSIATTTLRDNMDCTTPGISMATYNPVLTNSVRPLVFTALQRRLALDDHPTHQNALDSMDHDIQDCARTLLIASAYPSHPSLGAYHWLTHCLTLILLPHSSPLPLRPTKSTHGAIHPQPCQHSHRPPWSRSAIRDRRNGSALRQAAQQWQQGP